MNKRRFLTTFLFGGLTIFIMLYCFNETFDEFELEYSSYLSSNNSIKIPGLLCLVLTRPSSTNLQDAITDTWGTGCADLLFLVGDDSIADSFKLIERKPNVYTLIVKVEDAYDNTWMKVRAGLKFVNDTWPKKFDWFMRIDNDAFVILENLDEFLSTKDIQTPAMFGAHYIRYLDGYIGTGPGILLSQAAFTDLMVLFDDEKHCRTGLRTHNDDVELGVCLKAAKVPFGNSSDSSGRPRFISISLHDLLDDPQAVNHGFFELESAYPVGEGFDCCSDELIALHYVKAKEIRRFHRISMAHPLARKNLRLFIKQEATPRPTPAPTASNPHPRKFSQLL